jgi:hypothetical protein
MTASISGRLAQSKFTPIKASVFRISLSGLHFTAARISEERERERERERKENN